MSSKWPSSTFWIDLQADTLMLHFLLFLFVSSLLWDMFFLIFQKGSIHLINRNNDLEVKKFNCAIHVTQCTCIYYISWARLNIFMLWQHFIFFGPDPRCVPMCPHSDFFFLTRFWSQTEHGLGLGPKPDIAKYSQNIRHQSCHVQSHADLSRAFLGPPWRRAQQFRGPSGSPPDCCWA